MVNYWCKKFSTMTYPLASVHPLRTDKQTDERTTAMTIARPLLKYGRLKTKILWKPEVGFAGRE